MAENLAEQEGNAGRVEVLDVVQFLVANMLEWTAFEGTRRRNTFQGLIDHYNLIVEACETDPSLKIEIA